MEKLDVPQGTLDLMILTILSREPMHGYGISQRLATLSHDHFQVNPGSLFPSLYRLEQDGKLKAEWRPIGEQSQRQVLPAHARREEAAGTTSGTLEPDRVRDHRRAGGRMTLAASAGLGRCAGCSAVTARNTSWTRSFSAFVDLAAAEKVRDGMSPAEARRLAVLAARRRRAGKGTSQDRPARRVARRSRPRRALRRAACSSGTAASPPSSC